MKDCTMIVLVLLAVTLAGCSTLTEVRSKHKLGVEYRRRGSTDKSLERYLVQKGFTIKWANGSNTSIIYRRRDNNNGPDDQDNGVWFEYSYPIWKVPNHNKEKLARRVEILERRLNELTPLTQ